MKNAAILVLALILAMGAAGAQAYVAGTYTSRQFGMGGYFDVVTTFSDDAILSIEAPDNRETLMVGTEAIRILSDRAIRFQSLLVGGLCVMDVPPSPLMAW